MQKKGMCGIFLVRLAEKCKIRTNCRGKTCAYHEWILNKTECYTFSVQENLQSLINSISESILENSPD